MQIISIKDEWDSMARLNPEHIKAVIEMINEAPFFKHMSMRVTELDTGVSIVIGSIGTKHMNPFGGLHGGVFSSIIDTAAYWSAYCDLQEDQGLITIDLKVDLLAPVLDRTVLVKGKRLKSGNTLFLTEAQMFDGQGRLLAHGTSRLMTTHHKQTIQKAVDFNSTGKLPVKFISDLPPGTNGIST